jgi:mycothiol synthase
VLDPLLAPEQDVVAWVPGSPDPVVTPLRAHGFTVARRQFRMRARLPAAPPAVPADLTLRAFRPGHDEPAWLTVNNRAFANHPEQGGWIRSRLEQRETEPWFDPEGFLLAEVDGVLVGSCWTKVHDTPAGPLGEIFVIGVDPAAHGRGYGRVLVLAGLADLHDRRGCAEAILYVAEGNEAAIALYESIGFVRDRTDAALEWSRR